MSPALTIDCADGSVSIDGCSFVLTKAAQRADAMAHFGEFYRSQRGDPSSYEWLTFDGVSFGGQPCCFSLCFHQGQLTELHFAVSLPNETSEGNWPTRETIDREIAFVRKELERQLSRSFKRGEVRFAWGVAWSQFDQKGFQASAGLRYNA